MNNNQKATKRALLTSVMALVMCVVMLVGTTFAWFTDTASTAVNKIQAGNLDVDIVDKNGNSLDGESLSFKDVNNNTDILWEPGATFNLDSFKIVNKGNLAFKYKVIISGVNGSEKLLKAIDFTINGEPLADWDGILLPVGKEPIADKEVVGETDFITISGTMKKEAGNEYQGLSIDGIGITVVATQYTYEYDSNSNTYDENAKYNADSTITLKSQSEYGLVEVDGFLHTVAKNRLGYTNDTDYKIEKDLVFDGYMFVIEDESALKWGAYYLGSAFAYTPAAAYLKNDNAKYDPDVVAARETITFKNCAFIDKTGKASLVWGNEFSNVAVTVENCTFSGFKTAFQFGQDESNSSTFTMKNNKIVGKRGISLSGFVKDGTKIENNQFLLNGGADGYFVNVAQVVNYADAKIAITGNTVNTTNILSVHSSVKDAANLGSWNGIAMNNNKYNSDAVKVAGFKDMGSAITAHYEALVK